MNKSFLYSVALHGLIFALVAMIAVWVTPDKKEEIITITLIPSPVETTPEPKTKDSNVQPQPQIPLPSPKSMVAQPIKPHVIPKPLPVTAKTVQSPVATASVVVALPPKEAPAPMAVPKEPTPPDSSKPSASEREEAKKTYLAYLRETIDGRKIYPKNAKRLRQTGVVSVMFTVLADGTITKVSVAESSGFTLLDSAAEEILTGLEKVRPFPKELAVSKFEITLPISYTIR